MISRKEVRIFDQASLLKRVNGDVELFHEMIELFLEQTPQQLNALNTALQAEDFVAINHHAHSLKGSARTIGANALSEAAFQLEIASKKSKLEGNDELLNKIVYEFEEFKRVAKSFKNSASEQEKMQKEKEL